MVVVECWPFTREISDNRRRKIPLREQQPRHHVIFALRQSFYARHLGYDAGSFATGDDSGNDSGNRPSATGTTSRRIGRARNVHEAE